MSVLLFILYILLGVLLLLPAVVLLVTIAVQHRLRERYSVFVVKFVVDVITAGCLLSVPFLAADTDSRCDAAVVVSAAIPLMQAFLLLSESADWSFAAFQPVRFHSSSALSRSIPSIVSLVICLIIIITLTIIDAVRSSCSPVFSAVEVSYDIALFVVSIAVVVLFILWRKWRNSAHAKPMLFHLAASSFLQLLPLLLVVILKYSLGGGASVMVDIVSLLVAVHALAHTAFFVYNHDDCRQGIRATFVQFKIHAAL